VIGIADISMCQFSECEKKDTCYRYKAEPNSQYQSYMEFQNICNEKNGYQWYWKYE
jgi:hypothetical protein